MLKIKVKLIIYYDVSLSFAFIDMPNQLIYVGNECLFQLIERIKEVQNKYNDTTTTTTALSETTSPNLTTNIPTLIPDFDLNIIHSEITIEKKSSFQSHICTVTSMDMVNYFKQKVLEDKKVASATHNIFAYRFTTTSTTTASTHTGSDSNSSSNSSVVYHDYDDDGETAAGGRLAEMIRLMKVENVAVIVSRYVRCIYMIYYTVYLCYVLCCVIFFTFLPLREACSDILCSQPASYMRYIHVLYHIIYTTGGSVAFY